MEFTKPVKEEDIHKVEILSKGAKGDGIAKIDNFVIMVPDTEIGETYTIKITKVLNKMAFGEIIEDG